MIKEPIFAGCPIRNILARVGDKWSMLVMHEMELYGEAMRFSRLQRAIPDISQKMLTQTLRHLEADGFVTRKVYAEVPPRVEYQLTERARSFIEACEPMVRWSLEHYAEVMRDRERAENVDE